MSINVKQELIQTNWQDWVQYFQHNQTRLMSVDWDTDYQLTPAESQAIFRSVQQFQLGESSEGRNLLRGAQEYAARSGETAYVTAIELFIAEENRHATDLGRFMALQNWPQAKHDWVDSVFRVLRRGFNLEVSIVVLLVAEIVALVYYKALHDASASPILQTICRQILRDEVQHIRFQMDALERFRQGRGETRMMATRLMQRFLFCGTLLVVWAQHRPVYQAGGFTFRQFWSANWRRFTYAFENLPRQRVVQKV